MKKDHSSIIKVLWQRIQSDEVPALSAQLAYFFLLSLFPLLIFLVTLLPYLPISEQDLLRFIEGFAPGEAMNLIETNLHAIMQKDGKLLSFGVIATLWSASNGINAVVRAFNKSYDVEETRSFIVARGMSILLTIAMIIVFVIALVLPVFGKEIGLFLFSQLGLSEEFLVTWNALRWLISLAILFIVFTGLYWIAPNKKITCTSAIPGAVFATFGWAIVSYGFAFYVGNFGNYTATYGSIGAIIVLMIWFYLTAFIIIIGGEINAYFTAKEKNC